MILVISGIRDPAPEAFDDIDLAVLDAASAATEVRIGGALGVDTIAIMALAAHPAHVIVYVPYALRDQPAKAKAAVSEVADHVVELHLPRSKGAYLARNAHMLDGADRLLAFTDGRSTGGTAWMIRAARAAGIPVDVVSIPCDGLRANPPAPGDWPGPVFAGWPYVSARATGERERRSDLVRRMKSGDVPTAEVHRLAKDVAAIIRREPELAAAEAIATVPRRTPDASPSVALVARAIAAETGLLDWSDWLARTEAPIGGRLREFRLRYPPEEHARTMAPTYEVPRGTRAILLDDVLTFGGTMRGAMLVAQAAGATPVGLAILHSPQAEAGA